MHFEFFFFLMYGETFNKKEEKHYIVNMYVYRDCIHVFLGKNREKHRKGEKGDLGKESGKNSRESIEGKVEPKLLGCSSPPSPPPPPPPPPPATARDEFCR